MTAASGTGDVAVLVDWVRYVGIGVAVSGAVVTAPSGMKVLFGDISAAGGAGVQAVHRIAARYIPWLRRSVTVHPQTVTGSASMSVAAALTAAGSVWPAGLPEQIAELRKRVDELSDRITALRQEATGVISDLRADLDKSISELRTAVAELWQEFERREKQAAQIDAGGLPLIAAGIVLAGLPDHLVRHWYWATPLLVVSSVFMVFTIRRQIWQL